MSSDSNEPKQPINSSCISFKKRKKRSKSKQIMKASASNDKKRKLDESDNDNDEDDNHTNIQSVPTHSRKRRKLNEFCTATSAQSCNVSTSYISDRTVLPSGLEAQGAVVSVYVESTEDKRAEIEKKPSLTADGKIRYKGLKSQRDVRNDKSKPVKKAPKFLGVGPQRAPDNVKITCRFDYQPDICKDWKETGFCGYGASCKFLHDRGDYKAGWQIDHDWNKFEKKKNERLAGINMDKEEEEENWEIHSSDDEEVDADGLPFACYICRERFTDPVMTKCGHYFCSKCAIKKFMKSDACAVCGIKTGGSFQAAAKLIKKMKKLRPQQI